MQNGTGQQAVNNFTMARDTAGHFQPVAILSRDWPPLRATATVRSRHSHFSAHPKTMITLVSEPSDELTDSIPVVSCSRFNGTLQVIGGITQIVSRSRFDSVVDGSWQEIKKNQARRAQQPQQYQNIQHGVHHNQSPVDTIRLSQFLQ